MKIAFVVTEYPKTTETFIMRDVMDFHHAGNEIKLFYLTSFRKTEILHPFARPTLAFARGYPYFASITVLRAGLWLAVKRPRALAGLIRDIFSGSRRDPVMLLKSLFILPKSLRIAKELEAWDADHVHAAYAGHPATAAWIARRMVGVPFSVSSHAHDLFETQALLAAKLPEAEFVRTISEFNKAFILEHVPALASNPPVVIHVGITPAATPATRPGEDGAFRVLGEDGAFRVLYVGSLESRKGVDTLLHALAGLSPADWSLDVMGDGPEAGRLKALAASLGLSGQVRFLGRQENEAVMQAMAAASVLAVPSRIGPRNQTEGLPTVIVEALSQRLPVIATRLTGIPEIVRHEETGLLFEVDDVAGLASCLDRVRRNPEVAQSWANTGRALVEREFDQHHSSSELLGRIRLSLGLAADRAAGSAIGSDRPAP